MDQGLTEKQNQGNRLDKRTELGKKKAEITHLHTFAALIRLPTTTHNLFTFKICEISSNNLTGKNSAYWQMNTSGLFSQTRLMQVPGCRVTRSVETTLTLFSHREKKLPGSTFTYKSHAINFSKRKSKEMNEKEKALQEELSKAEGELEMTTSDLNVSRYQAAQEKLKTFYEEKNQRNHYTSACARA